MHKIEIAPLAKQRVLDWCGREHIFADIDPTKTAHIIVDLQNGFMAPGAAVEIPVAREIVPNVNRISAALRATGGINVFIRYLLDPPTLVASATRAESVLGWRAQRSSLEEMIGSSWEWRQRHRAGYGD